MAKNREASGIFNPNHISLLLDTSSIVRIRELSTVIPAYAELFDLYTLDKNKTELGYLLEKSPNFMKYSVELIQLIQMGYIKTLKNGAPNVSMPKKFSRQIDKDFPANNLSYTDKLLLYFSSSAPENVALVTNDRELHSVAEQSGLLAFGAFELHLIMENIFENNCTLPSDLNQLKNLVNQAKQKIYDTTPSSR